MMDGVLGYMSQSAEAPLLTAFVLGLFVAVNPCQLAISVSALAFVVRGDTSRRRMLVGGALYALGRASAYAALGVLLVLALSEGGTALSRTGGAGWMRAASEAVEAALPYALLAVGFFFLVRAFHRHHHDGSCHNSGRIIRRRGRFGAFLLGALLALVFCPESAVVYFGVMLPLGCASSAGALVPVAFAVGAMLPVLLLAYLFAMAVRRARRFALRMEHFQQWLNALSALLFLALGVLLLLAD